MKKLFLQTFGCQMNERDSEAVTGLLMGRGFEAAPSMEEADLILYNTCSVRDHAEQKVFGRLGAFRKLKEKKPGLVIGILGCMAQEHGEDFFKMNPEIDIVCGTGNLGQIADLVEEIERARAGATRRAAPALAIDKLDDEYGLDLPAGQAGGVRYRAPGVKALVTIMKGCDHRCTYCIVPYTRGREISRDPDGILREIKDLEARGFKDVTLLGQNVNSYGKAVGAGLVPAQNGRSQGSPLRREFDFVDLLERIQRHAPGIPRIRFITSHPKDAHTRLFRAMSELPSVCGHLHLPVQSGSDRILRRMKREHTASWYLGQVEEYRRFVPQGSLTTDFIVGFPGETEKDFEETLDLAERVQFDSAYVFAYSERPGTPAVKLPDDVASQEKNARLRRLLALGRSISLKKNQAWVGRTAEVLFEAKTRRGDDRWAGRTRAFKRVVVSSASDLEGQTRLARLTAAADETLLGELCA